GRTWCRAYATKLPNNNSGIDLDTDDQGRIFLAYNPFGLSGARAKLSLAVSFDDGNTFTDILVLDKGLGEYSYPSVVVKGDTIHITYTDERDYIGYYQIKIK
ncbi:MAG: exo-alpha-sialidase, partial [Acutalibacteraceae bacterium]